MPILPTISSYGTATALSSLRLPAHNIRPIGLDL